MLSKAISPLHPSFSPSLSPFAAPTQLVWQPENSSPVYSYPHYCTSHHHDIGLLRWTDSHLLKKKKKQSLIFPLQYNRLLVKWRRLLASKVYFSAEQPSV